MLLELIRRARTRDEQGIALVWLGGSLVLLLLAAGFAIDLIHAYAVGQRAQNAADAASMAGTVFLPDNPTTAKSRALSTVNDNGFSDGSGTAITVETNSEDSGLQPTQIRVPGGPDYIGVYVKGTHGSITNLILDNRSVEDDVIMRLEPTI